MRINVFPIGFKMEKFSTNLHVSEQKGLLPSPLERLGLSSLSQKDMPKRKNPTKWTFFFGGRFDELFIFEGVERTKNRQHIWGALQGSKFGRNLV